MSVLRSSAGKSSQSMHIMHVLMLSQTRLDKDWSRRQSRSDIERGHRSDRAWWLRRCHDRPWGARGIEIEQVSPSEWVEIMSDHRDELLAFTRFPSTWMCEFEYLGEV